MGGIAGTWDCVSSTPMGDQKSVMELSCDQLEDEVDRAVPDQLERRGGRRR
jgi:hypothetical protein